MVDRYLDPEGGDDANDGLSFAARKKTLASFGVVPAGDRVKIIRSPDPTSMGVCTWTDNNDLITIPAGLVKVLPGSGVAWTPSTNVTSSASTSTGDRKNIYNTAGTRINIASGFTTGKIAYYTFPSALDLSAFKSMTGWYYVTATLANTVLEIRFCSDTTGDVPVFTFPMANGGSSLIANAWNTIKKNNGTALPSSVQSISLYANSDPGTISVYLDNLIAALDPADTGAIDHNTLFGKNTEAEPWWYNICVFPSDTSVQVGGGKGLNASGKPQPYRGVTESVLSYSRRMLSFGGASSTNTLAGSGALENLTILSGGWDTTAMAAQDGVTILNCEYYPTYGLSLPASFVKVEKIGLANPSSYCIYQVPYGSDIQLEGLWGADNGSFNVFVTAVGWPGTKMNIKEIGCSPGGAFAYNYTAGWPIQVKIGRVSGHYGSSSPLGSISNYGYPESSIIIDEVSNNKNCGAWANTSSGALELKGTIFRWNGQADVRASAGGLLSLIGCSFLSDVKTIAPDSVSSVIQITAENGDPTNYSRINGAGTIGSAADQTHGGAGVSLKFNPGSVNRATDVFPLQEEIARVAVQAGSAVTVKVWCRRSDTGLSLGLGVKSGFVAGVTDTSAYMTAAADTWEQITLTFTPTAAGVIPIYGYAYGGTTYSGWIDDMTIDQA